MDDRLSIEHTTGIKPAMSSETVTTYHVHALKSLAKLLLHEVEFLENLTLDQKVGSDEPQLPLDKKLERIEIVLIRKALSQAGGHQVKAAKILEVRTSTLNAKLKRFGIDPRVFVPSIQQLNDQ